MRKLLLIATGLATLLPTMPALAGGQSYYGYSQPNNGYYDQRDNDDQDTYDRSYDNSYDRYQAERDRYQAQRDRYEAQRDAWARNRGDYYDRSANGYNGSYGSSYGGYYDRDSGYYTDRYRSTMWRGHDGRWHCRHSDGTTGVVVGGGAGVPRYCR